MKEGGRRALVIVGAALALPACILIAEFMGIPAKGLPAPPFSATTHTGQAISLESLKGRKNLVLSFYPKDFTAGCTRQLCAYRDVFSEFEALDAVVIGVSRDSPESQRRFASANGFPFGLVSDVRGDLSRTYGVLRLWGLIPVSKRVTFVVDKEGIIRESIHEEIGMERHRERALAVLRGLSADGKEEGERR